jgi:hypothetical protein
MQKLIFSLMALCTLHSLTAQTTPNPRFLCGNEVFSHVVREKYPALQAAFEATFEAAKYQSVAVAERSPLTVKVVVHVVWKNPAENLPDSVILNQIQILNEDFNRLNPDTANLRELFQPAAGNADIHFELADIVRVETSETFALNILGGSLLSELKDAAQGGSDAWDTEHYLNIWVCKIQPTTIFGIPIGQILGFAFPPNGLDNWPADSGAPTPEEDGVVIDFRVFGANNPNPLDNPTGGGGTLTVRGRTPVHEVGHYLGLRHIWGDGGLLGPNDCDQSDGVDDTPFANAQSEFDCDTGKNSCEQVEAFYGADVPDLVENFMDYSSESCMNMFTKGQVEIMRNVLQGPRSGLLSTPSATNAPENGLFWRVAPNPADERATIRLDLKEKSAVALRVLNAQGQTVRSAAPQLLAAGPQTLELDVRALPAGLYFVELRTETGAAAQQLLKK